MVITTFLRKTCRSNLKVSKRSERYESSKANTVQVLQCAVLTFRFIPALVLSMKAMNRRVPHIYKPRKTNYRSTFNPHMNYNPGNIALSWSGPQVVGMENTRKP